MLSFNSKLGLYWNLLILFYFFIGCKRWHRGAQALGMRGYLVKTGKYREGDEDKIHPSPYRTVDNFASAVEDILKELVIRNWL